MGSKDDTSGFACFSLKNSTKKFYNFNVMLLLHASSVSSRDDTQRFLVFGEFTDILTSDLHLKSNFYCKKQPNSQDLFDDHVYLWFVLQTL